MAKIHFRPYNPNQTVLFPQRIDEDIAEGDYIFRYPNFRHGKPNGHDKIIKTCIQT